MDLNVKQALVQISFPFQILVQPDTVYERIQYQFEEDAFDAIPDLITFYVGSGKLLSDKKEEIHLFSKVAFVHRKIHFFGIGGTYSISLQSHISAIILWTQDCG